MKRNKNTSPDSKNNVRNLESGLGMSAFTLVELIVVITILAILGTIAFLSFQGYSRDARDSVRISDIKNIETGLELFLTKAGTLPLPDNKIDVTSSGEIISYQGFAGSNVLNVLKIFNGGKDQVTGKYYTYTIDSIKKHYQVVGFLENGSQSSILTSNVYAGTNNLNIISRGSEIGVLLDQSNIPIQEISSIISSGNIDILNTNNTYTSYFNNTTSITGTGNALRGMVGGGGLVGYWSFDSMNGTGFTDYSPNNAISSFSGGVTLTLGQVGSAAHFDGVNGEFNVSKVLGLGESQGSPHTISAWIKVDNNINHTSPAYREWILLLGQPGPGSHHWLVGGFTLIDSQFGIWSGPQAQPNISSGVWEYISIVYTGLKIKLYINGKAEKNNTKYKAFSDMNIKNAKLNVGKAHLGNSYFKGAMDELRIYNRALSSFEIKQLYNIR